MTGRAKRAFTIVELMVAVAIIAVLLTIVTTASAGAIRAAREKRCEAMRTMLQAAITTYHAADSQGRWPGAIENAAEGAKSVVLGEEEAQTVFRIIVQKSTGESGSPLPLIDPHGLFVAPSGATDGRSAGLSYTAARHGDEHRRRKLPVAQMVFGYQGKMTGKFHRYNIVYHAETDSVTVTACCHDCAGVDHCTRSGSNDLCPKCHRNEQ